LLGKCFTTWTTLPALFTFVFLPGATSDLHPPVSTSWVAGIIGEYHWAQLNFYPLLFSNKQYRMVIVHTLVKMTLLKYGHVRRLCSLYCFYLIQLSWWFYKAASPLIINPEGLGKPMFGDGDAHRKTTPVLTQTNGVHWWWPAGKGIFP
jgi:hypothetical protein